jgi:hypothetical protein
MPQNEDEWDIYEDISTENSQCSLFVENTGKPLVIYWKNTTSEGFIINYEERKYENIKGAFFYDKKPLEMRLIYQRSSENNSGRSRDYAEKYSVPNLPCTTLVNAILNQEIVKIVPEEENPDIWVFKYYCYCPPPINTPIDTAISISIEYTFDFKNLECTYRYHLNVDNTT